jgi:hypothetical protein
MPKYCSACNGTGRAKTLKDGSYIRCWPCSGNGLDPAAYFRWTKTNG